VTSQEIAGLLAEQGFDIDRRKIVLDERSKPSASMMYR
jgi:ribosomal protein L9